MSLKLVKDSQNIENGPSGAPSVIFKGLNAPQAEAVRHIDGALLIIAGAGSGKTRVLTNRIAYMVEQGIAPFNILALTFTNKAADEMKKRIASMLTPGQANAITAGTFHSVFARILRREAHLLGYTTSFSIYDTDDSTSLVRSIMNQAGISIQQISPQAVRGKISSAKNNMKSWQEFAASADNSADKQVAQIFEAYERGLRSNNAMDFDDLLINMIHLIQNNPQVLDAYSERFKYILVDEYQDTNRAQYMAIEMLASKYKNICVVGDDAQSIYRWRGADIRNILEFERDYPNCKTIRLEQNYRSTQTIINAAGSVIKRNRKQLPKNLWTSNPVGEPIDVLECADDRAEAEKIADTIMMRKSADKMEFRDFSVLYRTNAQSLAIENAFKRSRIPYIVVGGMSFFKRKEIKDTVSYLKLLINPKDSESLVRVLNEPPRSIGPTSVRHLRDFAQRNEIPLFEAFRRSEEIGELQKRAVLATKEFQSMIQSFIDQFAEKKDPAILRAYIESTGMMQLYKDLNTEDSLDRYNNIAQLISDLMHYFKTEEEPSLEAYLSQISLASEIDNADTGENTVKVMTLHSAKGLEFPYVFLAGMEKGLFPMQRADQHPDELEEERRLFYVGITRAEQKLFLTLAQRRNRFGEYSNQAPSPFLFEIESKHLNWRENQRKPAPRQEFHAERVVFNDIPKNESYSQLTPTLQDGFRKGDTVSHAQFGEGKIESLDGFGTTRSATVFFKNVGRKKLLLQYAKLNKVK